ncbi:MAG: hydroxyacylglutathione hydrolase [Desulfobacteraceae bacterium]|nr:hydroxyacylglutathione hydrolase [Desulfobacteraceae bacterium]
MKIRQFRYGADNLGYLLYNDKSAVAIDGGSPEEILRFAKQDGLEIRYVTNTHSHPDHTSGNRELLENSGAEYLDFQTLVKTKKIDLGDERIEIFHTPGHTRDSVCFYSPPYLVSGDTLFNGKVGKCFTGNIETFLDSIKILLGLPEETLVYAGHDYVREYMEFIRGLEPDNIHIDKYLEKYDPGHVCFLLADEKRVDPFLRFNDEKIVSILKNRELAQKPKWTGGARLYH